MNQLLNMAFRDLGRNRRRSILSALAVSIATTLLIFMASVVRGEFRGALQNGIRLQTGHLQIRAASYEENKVSLAWEDLVLPGPDYVDRVMAQSDRSPQVLRNLQSLFDHGRLAGTGYVSILPVDQGIEHSGAASFAPNPKYFDPANIVELAI